MIKLKIFIGIIILLIGMLIGFSISNRLFKPPSIIIVEYDSIFIVDTVPEICYQFDTLAITDTFLHTIYQQIFDTIQVGYIPYVKDTAIFKTSDSLYTTYFYPSTGAYAGRFEYTFFPKPDSIFVVENTKQINPRLCISPYVSYDFQSLNAGVGISLFGYGVIGGLQFKQSNISYSIGLIKHFNFF